MQPLLPLELQHRLLGSLDYDVLRCISSDYKEYTDACRRVISNMRCPPGHNLIFSKRVIEEGKRALADTYFMSRRGPLTLMVHTDINLDNKQVSIGSIKGCIVLSNCVMVDYVAYTELVFACSFCRRLMQKSPGLFSSIAKQTIWDKVTTLPQPTSVQETYCVMVFHMVAGGYYEHTELDKAGKELDTLPIEEIQRRVDYMSDVIRQSINKRVDSHIQ